MKRETPGWRERTTTGCERRRAATRDQGSIAPALYQNVRLLGKLHRHAPACRVPHAELLVLGGLQKLAAACRYSPNARDLGRGEGAAEGERDSDGATARRRTGVAALFPRHRRTTLRLIFSCHTTEAVCVSYTPTTPPREPAATCRASADSGQWGDCYAARVHLWSFLRYEPFATVLITDGRVSEDAYRRQSRSRSRPGPSAAARRRASRGRKCARALPSCPSRRLPAACPTAPA